MFFIYNRICSSTQFRRGSIYLLEMTRMPWFYRWDEFIPRDPELIDLTAHMLNPLRCHLLYRDQLLQVHEMCWNFKTWGLPSLKLTASLHLKMDGWKTNFSFWVLGWFVFAGQMLVSGRLILVACFAVWFLWSSLIIFPRCSMYGIFEYTRWKLATFKGQCRETCPTWSIWVCFSILEYMRIIQLCLSHSRSQII